MVPRSETRSGAHGRELLRRRHDLVGGAVERHVVRASLGGCKRQLVLVHAVGRDEHEAELQGAEEAEGAEPKQEAVAAEPQGLTEKQLEARFKRIGTASQTYNRRLDEILGDDAKLRAVVSSELADVAKTYGTPRRTWFPCSPTITRHGT